MSASEAHIKRGDLRRPPTRRCYPTRARRPLGLLVLVGVLALTPACVSFCEEPEPFGLDASSIDGPLGPHQFRDLHGRRCVSATIFDAPALIDGLGGATTGR